MQLDDINVVFDIVTPSYMTFSCKSK